MGFEDWLLMRLARSAVGLESPSKRDLEEDLQDLLQSAARHIAEAEAASSYLSSAVGATRLRDPCVPDIVLTDGGDLELNSDREEREIRVSRRLIENAFVESVAHVRSMTLAEARDHIRSAIGQYDKNNRLHAAGLNPSDRGQMDDFMKNIGGLMGDVIVDQAQAQYEFNRTILFLLGHECYHLWFEADSTKLSAQQSELNADTYGLLVSLRGSEGMERIVGSYALHAISKTVLLARRAAVEQDEAAISEFRMLGPSRMPVIKRDELMYLRPPFRETVELPQPGVLISMNADMGAFAREGHEAFLSLVSLVKHASPDHPDPRSRQALLVTRMDRFIADLAEETVWEWAWNRWGARVVELYDRQPELFRAETPEGVLKRVLVRDE